MANGKKTAIDSFRSESRAQKMSLMKIYNIFETVNAHSCLLGLEARVVHQRS